MVRKSRKQEQRDQDILERIGADRMASYLAEVHGHTGRALDLYRWNAELSGSFWSLISLTEVSLRNALDEHLGTWCQANGGHRDWLLHIDHAPDDLKAEFSGKTRTFRSRAEDAKKIRDTGAGLTVKPHRRQHASLTNGDILSQITLGEWGSFIPSPPRVLDDGTRQPFPDLTTAQRRERLWDNVVCQAFPGGQQPHNLGRDLYLLKLFRNRIAHHEPIFTVNYRRHRNDLLAILHGVAPPVQEWYTSTDPLPTVFKNDPRSME